MRILLDTHFLVWGATDASRLTPDERLILGDPGVEIICSTVSLWELRLKWNSVTPAGARKGPIAPETLLGVAQRAGWTVLPLSPEHAVATLEAPVAHKDPFDELLLVQAQVEGMRLLTRDKALLAHPLVYR